MKASVKMTVEEAFDEDIGEASFELLDENLFKTIVKFPDGNVVVEIRLTEKDRRKMQKLLQME